MEDRPKSLMQLALPTAQPAQGVQLSPPGGPARSQVAQQRNSAWEYRREAVAGPAPMPRQTPVIPAPEPRSVTPSELMAMAREMARPGEKTASAVSWMKSSPGMDKAAKALPAETGAEPKDAPWSLSSSLRAGVNRLSEGLSRGRRAASLMDVAAGQALGAVGRGVGNLAKSVGTGIGQLGGAAGSAVSKLRMGQQAQAKLAPQPPESTGSSNYQQRMIQQTQQPSADTEAYGPPAASAPATKPQAAAAPPTQQGPAPKAAPVQAAAPARVPLAQTAEFQGANAQFRQRFGRDLGTTATAAATRPGQTASPAQAAPMKGPPDKPASAPKQAPAQAPAPAATVGSSQPAGKPVFQGAFDRLNKMRADRAAHAASPVGQEYARMTSKSASKRTPKVKEIYNALKRDHPGMPAEMKARIAARQGKPGKQKQGPPYKGELSGEKRAFSGLGSASDSSTVAGLGPLTGLVPVRDLANYLRSAPPTQADMVAHRALSASIPGGLIGALMGASSRLPDSGLAGVLRGAGLGALAGGGLGALAGSLGGLMEDPMAGHNAAFKALSQKAEDHAILAQLLESQGGGKLASAYKGELVREKKAYGPSTADAFLSEIPISELLKARVHGTPGWVPTLAGGMAGSFTGALSGAGAGLGGALAAGSAHIPPLAAALGGLGLGAVAGGAGGAINAYLNKDRMIAGLNSAIDRELLNRAKLPAALLAGAGALVGGKALYDRYNQPQGDLPAKVGHEKKAYGRTVLDSNPGAVARALEKVAFLPSPYATVLEPRSIAAHLGEGALGAGYGAMQGALEGSIPGAGLGAILGGAAGGFPGLLAGVEAGSLLGGGTMGLLRAIERGGEASLSEKIRQYLGQYALDAAVSLPRAAGAAAATGAGALLLKALYDRYNQPQGDLPAKVGHEKKALFLDVPKLNPNTLYPHQYEEMASTLRGFWPSLKNSYSGAAKGFSTAAPIGATAGAALGGLADLAMFATTGIPTPVSTIGGSLAGGLGAGMLGSLEGFGKGQQMAENRFIAGHSRMREMAANASRDARMALDSATAAATSHYADASRAAAEASRATAQAIANRDRLLSRIVDSVESGIRSARSAAPYALGGAAALGAGKMLYDYSTKQAAMTPSQVDALHGALASPFGVGPFMLGPAVTAYKSPVGEGASRAFGSAARQIGGSLVGALGTTIPLALAGVGPGALFPASLAGSLLGGAVGAGRSAMLAGDARRAAEAAVAKDRRLMLGAAGLGALGVGLGAGKLMYDRYKGE